MGLNTVSAYQRAKVSALKIVNLGMRRNNNTTRKESQVELREEKSDGGLPTTSPIIKQKAKCSKKSTNKNSLRMTNEQASLSIDPIEPIHPSNIVKNTHKTRI